MVRLFHAFIALPIAFPLLNLAAEVSKESGETAIMDFVEFVKPDVDGYARASVRVATTETQSGPRRIADVYLLECSRAYPYPCTTTFVQALLPMKALAVTGRTAVFEHDYAGDTEVLHRESFFSDDAGNIGTVPYVPKSIRLVLTENGLVSHRTNGTTFSRYPFWEIKTTGQTQSFTADVTGSIWGNTLVGVGFGTIGTSHSNVVERTRTGKGSP